jgi:hypothetical protein
MSTAMPGSGLVDGPSVGGFTQGGTVLLAVA